MMDRKVRSLERWLGLITALQGGRRLTVPELAERFGVSTAARRCGSSAGSGLRTPPWGPRRTVYPYGLVYRGTALYLIGVLLQILVAPPIRSRRSPIRRPRVTPVTRPSGRLIDSPHL